MLYGEGSPKAPSVNATGGFDAYTPLAELAPYQAVMVEMK
jgi:hypothetical protein